MKRRGIGQKYPYDHYTQAKHLQQRPRLSFLPFSSQKRIDDITLAPAKSEPSSLSGPPLSYIVTELSAMKRSDMLKNGMWKEDHAEWKAWSLFMVSRKEEMD